MADIATAFTYHKASGKQSLEVTNPITVESLGHVPRHTAADMIHAIEVARAAQPAWATLSYRQRAQVMIRFHDIILRDREELYDVIQSESGKSRRDAFLELFAVVCEARYYAYNGEKFLRPRHIKPAIFLRDRGKVLYQPWGVIGIISPWNFPFILGICDAIPALLAGNAVVSKPSSLTPFSAIWAHQKMLEAGLPPEVLHMLTGPANELGEAMVEHVNYVMFTGSTATGKKIAEHCGRRLVPYSMELGGKNALLVLPDADLKHSATVAIEGSFNNSGQVCINFERLYIHEKIYEPFKAELVRQLDKVRLGSGHSFDYDIGSLISKDQLEATETHVKDAISKGATIVAGAKRRPDLGPYYYEPTVLENVAPNMTLYKEETFGPVISLYKFDTLDEAVRQANASRYGLHLGICTSNLRAGERLAAKLEAGSVCINDSYMNWGAVDGPMGGYKESGVFRRHGPEGLRKYAQPQTILTNQTRLQIGSMETALSINQWLADVLVVLLRVWRYVPFLR
jgi:succinate-semialdehyde dehydrogenase/glutarate-semialdehyde dehydrogenase